MLSSWVCGWMILTVKEGKFGRTRWSSCWQVMRWSSMQDKRRERNNLKVQLERVWGKNPFFGGGGGCKTKKRRIREEKSGPPYSARISVPCWTPLWTDPLIHFYYSCLLPVLYWPGWSNIKAMMVKSVLWKRLWHLTQTSQDQCTRICVLLSVPSDGVVSRVQKWALVSLFLVTTYHSLVGHASYAAGSWGSSICIWAVM